MVMPSSLPNEGEDVDAGARCCDIETHDKIIEFDEKSFENKLFQLCDHILPDNVYPLGIALRFSTCELDRFVNTNRKYDGFTHDGTRQMLQKWFNKTEREERETQMRHALVETGMQRLADIYFPKTAEVVSSASELVEASENKKESNTGEDKQQSTPNIEPHCIDDVEPIFESTRKQQIRYDTMINFEERTFEKKLSQLSNQISKDKLKTFLMALDFSADEVEILATDTNTGLRDMLQKWFDMTDREERASKMRQALIETGLHYLAELHFAETDEHGLLKGEVRYSSTDRGGKHESFKQCSFADEGEYTSARYSADNVIPFEEMLNDLSKEIPSAAVLRLGAKLGFSHAETTTFHQTNARGSSITTEGTREMLQTWYDKTKPTDRERKLREALKHTSLTRLAVKYVPERDEEPFVEYQRESSSTSSDVLSGRKEQDDEENVDITANKPLTSHQLEQELLTESMKNNELTSSQLGESISSSENRQPLIDNSKGTEDTLYDTLEELDQRNSSSLKFEQMLTELAKKISPERVHDLGVALELPNSAIRLFKNSNLRGSTHEWQGTRDMLQEWFNRTHEGERKTKLRDALNKAGLVELADRFVPEMKNKTSLRVIHGVLHSSGPSKSNDEENASISTSMIRKFKTFVLSFFKKSDKNQQNATFNKSNHVHPSSTDIHESSPENTQSPESNHVKVTHSNSSDGTMPALESSVLEKIAKDIPQDTIHDLGEALGFSSADIKRFKDSNFRGQSITYDGTRHMLHMWQERTSPVVWLVKLRDALIDAGLSRIAIIHLGISSNSDTIRSSPTETSFEDRLPENHTLTDDAVYKGKTGHSDIPRATSVHGVQGTENNDPCLNCNNIYQGISNEEGRRTEGLLEDSRLSVVRGEKVAKINFENLTCEFDVLDLNHTNSQQLRQQWSENDIIVDFGFIDVCMLVLFTITLTWFTLLCETSFAVWISTGTFASLEMHPILRYIVYLFLRCSL